MGYKFETLTTKYGVKARITLGVSMLAPTSQCDACDTSYNVPNVVLTLP